MIILGLTGSIGMGKSTVAQMFAEAGAAVFNADGAAHALYAKSGAAVAPVESAFPGVAREGAIDRTLLGARVLDDPAAMGTLEAIVHPLVRAAQKRFLAEQEAAGARVAVLEIPLLFESGTPALVDKVVVVSAPAETQRARVLARSGMSEAKFAKLAARQSPDAEKRARADFVIDTGCSLEETRAQVAAVLDALSESG
jgi:dephospho-CoA kinase